MALRDLIVQIKTVVDSTGLSDVNGEIDDIKDSIGDADVATRSWSDTVIEHSAKIGAAMTAAGGAIVLLTDSARKTNAELGVTAHQLGITTDEMRDLALETTNVTFPLEEVTATFDLLTRAGMDSKEEIQATATALDTLGDAIGMNASEVTQTMIPILKSFDIALEDTGDHTDTITHLLRNTTIQLGDLSSAMNYIGPELDVMGMGLDDTAALLEAMSAQGVEGSRATRELRTAVTEADGDINLLYASLGLTTDEVEKYKDEIAGATGTTQEYADVANEQYGIMDKAKQKFEELTLSVGSMLAPFEGVGAAMAVMGPMLMGLGPIMSMVSSIGVGAVVPSLLGVAGAAWAALAPFLPIIAVIGAVIAIGYVLETRFGVLSAAFDMFKEAAADAVERVKGAWDSLIQHLQPLFDWIGSAIGRVGDWFEENEEIISAAVGNVQAVISWVVDQIWSKVSWVIDAIVVIWEWVWPYISQYLDASLDVLLDVFGVFAALFAGDWDALKEAIVDLAGSMMSVVISVVEFGYDALMGITWTLGDSILGLFGSMWDGVVGLAETGAQNLLAPVNAILEAVGKDAIEVDFGFAKGAVPTMESLFGEAPTLRGGVELDVPTDMSEHPAFAARESVVEDVAGVTEPLEDAAAAIEQTAGGFSDIQKQMESAKYGVDPDDYDSVEAMRKDAASATDQTLDFADIQKQMESAKYGVDPNDYDSVEAMRKDAASATDQTLDFADIQKQMESAKYGVNPKDYDSIEAMRKDAAHGPSASGGDTVTFSPTINITVEGGTGEDDGDTERKFRRIAEEEIVTALDRQWKTLRSKMVSPGGY